MAKEDVAMQVLQQVVKLPVVKVNRSKFLMDKFSKEVASRIFLDYWMKGRQLYYLRNLRSSGQCLY